MTSTPNLATETSAPHRRTGVRARPRCPSRVLLYLVLALAGIIFVFPFYFMVVGALAGGPDHHPGRPRSPPVGWTLENFALIDERVPIFCGRC
jgi:multiple sugar transport system permease protein